jgi:hypothetical protein
MINNIAAMSGVFVEMLNISSSIESSEDIQINSNQLE